MLVRATRRHLQRHDLSPTSACIGHRYCPKLYLKGVRPTSTIRAIPVTQSKYGSLLKTPRALSSRTESRHLATAADLNLPPTASVPFEGLPNISVMNPHLQSAMPTLSSWDPSQPLIIHDSLATPQPRLRFMNGIGGEPAELLQNLHACLRVGRIDRAAALIRRLMGKIGPTSSEVLDAHNLYLEALAQTISQGQPGFTISMIEDWFEKEICGKGVQPDARIFVTLIQSSISLMKEGEERDTVIRKYLQSAEDMSEEIFHDTMESEDFTESDFLYLVGLQPEKFQEPPSTVDQPLPEGPTSVSNQTDPERVLPSPRSADVKPVQQKGFGLATLKKSLSMFNDDEEVLYPHQLDASKEEKDRVFAHSRQVRLEEDCVDAAIDRWRKQNDQLHKMGISSHLQSKPLEALMWQWYNALLPPLKKELEEVRAVLNATCAPGNDQSDRLIYGSYLELFTVQQLAAVTVLTMMRSIGIGDPVAGLKLSLLTSRVGETLESEYLKGVHLKSLPSTGGRSSSSRRSNILAKLSKRPYRLRPKAQPGNTETSRPYSELPAYTEIPVHVKARVGALLIEKLLETATITVSRKDRKTGETLTAVQPALSHCHSYYQGKKIGRITVHHSLMEHLKREPLRGSIGTRLPMLCEPRSWQGFKAGGFLRYPVQVVRSKGSDETQIQYATAAIRKGDMDMVFAGLDVLGKTPWKINKQVFQVMLEAWNSGEAIGKIAPENPNIPIPPEADPLGDPVARRHWIQEIKRIEELKGGYHSQRCFQNFQLEVARAYLNETFYYPHNVDFRGRAYPIPQVLNHMGADLARGLLVFGNGKRLGTVGLSWLKIHLANLYGFDKASLKEREDFAMEHLDDIYDSATNPLSGRRWWLKAEDPWQCLATCFELKNAFDAPDPSQYISYLPVHQDGTCNGLQHYAALGGDKAGASQVNLEPSDRPSDIYTTVAEMVKAEVEAEADSGSIYAKFLQGKITRKVVKRTVMTNVYGVTFSGARLQVLDELEEIFPDFKPTHEIHSLSALATDIARKIFKAVSTLFNGAYAIQCWLGECAERISMSITQEQILKMETESKQRALNVPGKKRTSTKVTNPTLNFKSSVIWTTPLRMPVAQPYRSGVGRQIRTGLQSITIKEPRASDPVSKRKQLQAFPPNFIHSLDATHMILSALKCNENGLTFASVHDSFWTHAADVPSMNLVLRDAFVRMHSEDIVGRLAEEFKARYAGSMYLASVEYNSALGKRIRIARQRLAADFSKEASGSKFNQAEELLLETRRLQLLQSTDPNEREQAKGMITPGSIYAAGISPEDTIQPPAPLKGTLLGEIPKSRTNKASLKERADNEELEDSPDGTPSVSDDVDELATGDFDDSVASSKDELDNVLETQEDSTLLVGVKRMGRQPKSKITVWVPLSFPPVPQKGDFDVTRLKESKYFFS